MKAGLLIVTIFSLALLVNSIPVEEPLVQSSERDTSKKDNEQADLATQDPNKIPPAVADEDSEEQEGSTESLMDTEMDSDEIFFVKKVTKKVKRYFKAFQAAFPLYLKKYVAKYGGKTVPGATLLDQSLCSFFSNDVYEDKTNLKFDGVRQLHFLNHRASDTQARIWANDQVRTVWVAFRGMQFTKLKDILTNIKFTRTKCKLTTDCKGRVHRGYQSTIMHKHIKTVLLKHIEPYVKKGYRMVFTGHSQGAALALMFSLVFEDHMLKQFGKKVVPIVVTFGSPRLGNSDFVKYVATRLPDVTRVVSQYKSRACGIFDKDPGAHGEQSRFSDSEMATKLNEVSEDALQTATKFHELASSFREHNETVRDQYGRRIRRFFRRAGRWIKKKARGVKKKLGSWVKKAASKVLKAKKWFKKIGSKIKKGFKKTWTKVKSNVSKAVKAFGRGIKKLAKKGWKFAKKIVKKVGKILFRSKTAWDMVSSFPPKSLGYRHVGKTVVVGCPYSCSSACCSITHLFGSIICHKIIMYSYEVTKIFTKTI